MNQWCHTNNTSHLIAVSIAKIALKYKHSFDLHTNPRELAMQNSHVTKKTEPQIIRWLAQPIQLSGTVYFVIQRNSLAFYIHSPAIVVLTVRLWHWSDEGISVKKDGIISLLLSLPVIPWGELHNLLDSSLLPSNIKITTPVSQSCCVHYMRKYIQKTLTWYIVRAEYVTD